MNSILLRSVASWEVLFHLPWIFVCTCGSQVKRRAFDGSRLSRAGGGRFIDWELGVHGER